MTESDHIAIKRASALKKGRISLKTAKELAIKVLGSAKNLERDPTYDGAPVDAYQIQMGDFRAVIRGAHDSGCILVELKGPVGSSYGLYDPVTLEEDYRLEDTWRQEEKNDWIADWIDCHEPEYIFRQIKEQHRLPESSVLFPKEDLQTRSRVAGQPDKPSIRSQLEQRPKQQNRQEEHTL